MLEKYKEIIENNPIAFATVDLENKPNVIAVADVRIVSADEVVIADNYMKQTAENIKNNSAVCLAVWNKDWEGCKLIGTAEYFSSGKWLDFVKSVPEHKGYATKGAILVKVNQCIELK
jgi:predicted pyridoxine 5'-phosphate oxidase superfamily flavin-nucleotide-binding protein